MGLKFSIPYQIPFYETDITHQVKLPHLLAFSLQVSAMQLFPIIRFSVTVIFTSQMKQVNKSCSLRLLLPSWIMKRER